MTLPTSPSTTLYTVGRGILYIGEWSGSTPPISLTDIGAVSGLTVKVLETKQNKYKFRSGVKVKDGIVVMIFDYSLSFVADEKSIFNLKAFLKASLHGTNVLYAGMSLTKEYQIRFRADNLVGYNEVWEFHRVSLSPGNDANLIADDFSKLVFIGEGIPDYTYHSEDPFFDVIEGSTTTTTSTISTTSTTN